MSEIDPDCLSDLGAISDMTDLRCCSDLTAEIERSLKHPRVPHGRCPICGHYGDDCTGE